MLVPLVSPVTKQVELGTETARAGLRCVETESLLEKDKLELTCHGVTKHVIICYN